MRGKFNSGAKGQAQLIAVFLLLVLVPTTVIVAQNATNSTGVDGMVTDVNLTETPPIEDILNETEPELSEENTTEPAEEPQVNVTEPQDNVTTPDENITVPEENITIPEENATNITEPDENVTLPEENVTVPDENVTQPNENITEPEENVTEPEANVTEPEDNKTVEVRTPDISVVLMHSEKVTRYKEDTTLRAVITNAGDPAYNLMIEWILPPGFAIVDGSSTEHTEVLGNSETFTSEITVFPVIQTPLGLAEIRARVSYE